MRVNVEGFDQIKSSMEVLPVGQYPVIIKTCEEGTSSEGSKYLAWTGMVAEGQHQGRTLYWNTSLKPAALFKLKQLVESAGVDFDANGFDTESMIGSRISATVSIKTYQGNEKNEVTGFLPQD